MEQTITQNGALYLVQRKQAATRSNGENTAPRRALDSKGKSDRDRFRHLPAEEEYLYRDNGR